MELRILRYFLTVAKEQSFTKAAEQLHITQPTLSRQLAAFEEELGIVLFVRKGKSITLTDEGILLKRRALEILNLEERTLEELRGTKDVIEGTVTFGCGEFTTVETLAKICKRYKEKYPLVQMAIHTATWVVGICPDDPLAGKRYIEKKELLDKPLILPERVEVQSELANWFGKDFSNLDISFISNLGTNAGVMAANGLGYPISIEGAVKYWREDILVQRRLYPEITANCVIAWRRNIPYSQAVNKMIEEINAFLA